MTCHKLKELLKAEREDLTDEINKHKYYMSQRHNFDVGWDFAERDFLLNHLNSWAEGYKKCYCSCVCQEECEYRRK